MSLLHALGSAAAAPRMMRATAAAAVIVLLAALPAAAVGVDGVDIRVDLPTGANDRPLLDLRSEDSEVEIVVRNTLDEPREVRVYAVAASPAQDTGSFDLGGLTSATWFGLDDQRFTLGEREQTTLIASASDRGVPEEASHVAVVLETGTDSTVVTRAARVIELSERDPFGLPLWLIILAGLLLVAAIGAHVAEHRSRSRVGEPGAGPWNDPAAATTDSARTREREEIGIGS